MKQYGFYRKFKVTCFILVIFLFVFATNIYAQTTSIVGSISDSEDKSPLPYATVVIKGTNIGVSTNLDGKYTLSGVPFGKCILLFSYIGYSPIEKEVNLKDKTVLTLDVQLKMQSVMGKEVTVTAQMRGQAQAINQQVNSKGIVNIVSMEKLKELPDGNAADAIGRLPGIMVQRNGGEGEKVIIRGLDPKYSTVSVNGTMAPSSSATDRSVNLNLISPDIISGIEIMKANTADKDADGLGGTVNMLVREADKNMKFNFSMEGGYSGQIKNFGHGKGSMFYSNRFFNQKLGLMLSGNAEFTDRSSDQLSVDYGVVGNPVLPATFVKPYTEKINLEANLEMRKRYNVSANIDFNIGQSSFKLVNMYSLTDRNILEREKQFALDANSIRFSQNDIQIQEWMVSNALEAKHLLGNVEITWGAARSETMQNKPYDHALNFRCNSAFAVSPSLLNLLDPLEATKTENLINSLSAYYLYDGTMLNSKAQEKEWSSWVNLQIPFNISSQTNGYIKVGGKARWKDRKRSSKRWNERFDTFASPIVDRDLFDKADNGYVGIGSFLDNDFSASHYLNDLSPNLNMNYVLDRNVVSNWYDRNISLYEYLPTIQVKEDYRGTEQMYAAYIMGEINFGKYVTFIPGLRLDNTHLTYTGYKGDGIPPEDDSSVTTIDFTEQTESSDKTYLLPQIHLKVKPFTGFDIRLAYTNTLSRPDYDYLPPRTQISPNNKSVKYTTTRLKPALSENFDVIFSYYNPKYGLFSVGGFHKNISNFIYTRSAYINIGTETDPTVFNLPYETRGFQITYPRNNPAMSTITGLEIEGQFNFKFLPNPFKGLVLSANFTYMKSETKYQSTLFKRIANPNYGQPGEPKILFINNDTSYVDRMMKQPDILANFSIGYDIKGFSARLSYSYQGNVMTTPQYRTDGADTESTLSFSRWDVQIKQKIGKRLSIYGNISNIFNEPDRAVRNITNYYTEVEYYGMAANLGIKINF